MGYLRDKGSSAYTKGLHGKALPWQTKGLELALAAGRKEGEAFVAAGRGAGRDDGDPGPGSRRAEASR